MSADAGPEFAAHREGDVMGGAGMEAHASHNGVAAGEESFAPDDPARAIPDQEQGPSSERLGDLDEPVARGRLLFWVTDTLYSGALVDMREAVPTAPAVTPVPFSPAWLYGVFPLRTELVTLVDPRPFLGQGDYPHASGGMAASGPALLLGENGRLVGLLVDRIGDIVGAPSDDVAGAAPAPGHDTADAAPTDLDLAMIYSEIIAKLEAWADHV